MADATYQPKNYKKDGGDTQIVASGGVVDFEAGSGLKISGSDRTAALATAPAAIAAGYKVARGQQTTVGASDTVVTGLATVVAAVACLDSDPTDNPEWVTCSIGDQAGTPAAGSILIKTWQNTTGTDPTPTAASTFSKKVNWIAIGT
jgi:hypothetical protein